MGVCFHNAGGIGGSDGNSWKRGMIYNRGTPYGGVWHCPYSREWVERMKRAAKHCERLSSEYIEMVIDGEYRSYKLPPGDFLSEPQDARGLPLSWCFRYENEHRNWPKCCTAIYDYDSIPEIVVTNGEDDWPLPNRRRVFCV